MGIALLAEKLLASQEEFCSTEFVTIKSTVFTAQHMSNWQCMTGAVVSRLAFYWN
jgi:hypothetical protein